MTVRSHTGRPLIVRTGLGVGDVLLATVLIRRWAADGCRPWIVETRYPELFLNSPDVGTVVRCGWVDRWTGWTAGQRLFWRVGSAVKYAVDAVSVSPTYPFPHRGSHILSAMAASVGCTIDGPTARPAFYLSAAERAAAREHTGSIIVQSNSSRYWTVNKDWVAGRMQEVVNGLRMAGARVIQLGSDHDDLLEGVCDLRGRTSLRSAAAILEGAKLFVGLEGGLVHLSRAVGLRSVVVYTGYTRPEENGYADNINIRAASAGESCFRRDLCDHCRASAEAVSSDEVLSAVLQQLGVPTGPRA